jgi:hypothetical protein
LLILPYDHDGRLVLLSFFIRSLHCLTFDLWLPTTTWTSSNFSCINDIKIHYYGGYLIHLYQQLVQDFIFVWQLTSGYPRLFRLYSIHHYVVKFVSDLWQVGGFLRVLLFPPLIKLTATIYLKFCWKNS